MSGRAALVTGASDRIGKAIALELARLGFDIVLHYNNSKEKAQELQQRIEQEGSNCLIQQADFKREADIENLFRVATDAFNLEMIVNNASDFVPSSIDDAGCGLLNEMMQVNFYAPYLLTKLFAKAEKKGAIINLLDTKISKNQSRHLDYILSKKTLEAFTLQMASALGGRGIRVNAIAPGLILPPAGEELAYLEAKARAIPLQKIGSLEAICAALRYLVNNDFATGQILYIDGGEHL